MIRRLGRRLVRRMEKPAALAMGLVHVALWTIGLWWVLGNVPGCRRP